MRFLRTLLHLVSLAPVLATPLATLPFTLPLSILTAGKPFTNSTLISPTDWVTYTDPTSHAALQIAFVCKTTASSPHVSDVVNCVSQLMNLGNDDSICRQTNVFPPYCGRMVQHKTAALGICGVFGWGWHPGCGGAPSLYAELITGCRKDVDEASKVGGVF